MTDNTQLSSAVGTGDKALTFDVSFSSDAVKLQGIGIFGVTGTPETWTINPINGSTANGLYVDVRNIQAGTALIGDVGLGTRTTGGPTSHRNIDAGTTGTVVKNSAGQVYWLHVTNTRTTPLYLKLYSKSTAATQADTPVHTFLIPSQGDTNGAGFVLPLPLGVPFGSGIGYRVTTGLADNDTGAPAANTCIVNMSYK